MPLVMFELAHDYKLEKGRRFLKALNGHFREAALLLVPPN